MIQYRTRMHSENMATSGTYATKAGQDGGSHNAGSGTGKPVFFKNRDVPMVYESVLSAEDCYKALAKAVSVGQIKGIQRIGGLWRVYIDSRDARINLITNGLNIRNANIAVYDTNPFSPDGREDTHLDY